MSFGPTVFRQNYPEDPLGEIYIGSFWLFFFLKIMVIHICWLIKELVLEVIQTIIPLIYQLIYQFLTKCSYILFETGKTRILGVRIFSQSNLQDENFRWIRNINPPPIPRKHTHTHTHTHTHLPTSTEYLVCMKSSINELTVL